MDEPANDEPFGWNEINRDFELRSVKIIATMGQHRGGIFEQVPRLNCSEGRLHTHTYRDDGFLHQLEYHFGFSSSEEAEPLPSQASPGRIVITGIHSNGLRLEIRGDGWIGYDSKGAVEGNFDKPPVIITEDDDPEPEPETELDAEEDEVSSFRFPVSPHYEQALRVVPPPGEADPFDE